MTVQEVNRDSDAAPVSAVNLIGAELTFSGAQQAVIRIPELIIRRGEFVAIVGPSGCGKSTLLRMIAGLLIPTVGLVRTGSVRTGSGARVSGCRVGFVFQDATLLPWRSAVDNVCLPAELGAAETRGTRQQALDLLQLTGLPAADADKRPAQLSGGMRMRVSLARALVTEPELLLLDEPFAALDDILRSQLQQEVRRIHNQRGVTTVLVTHNIHEAVFMSDRVLVMGGLPATVTGEIAVPLPVERTNADRTSPEFGAVVRQVMDTLHV